jgi:exopolysaccharide biosynthesis protein PssK
VNHRPDEALVARWSDEIDHILGALLPLGSRVALVNFPNHANAGDPALWLGERAALDRIGAEVAYTASWASYDADTLRRELGDGTVLIHAGANFGDLYPHRQATTRERLLAELADLRTIQLPQSIHFEDPDNRDRLRRLCEEHADFTLLTREPQSQEYAHRWFDVPSLLCPDPAFSLGMRPLPTEPRADVLWLARTDPEAAGYEVPDAYGMSIEALDWLAPLEDEPPWSLGDRWRRAINSALLPRFERGSGVARRLWKLNAGTFDPLAERWVDRGCRILARGYVVVTDRLHGHVLSLLQGIPHVVLDNSYGKLRSVYDHWTFQCTLAHWADSPDEAVEVARSLLEDDPR